MQSTLLTVSQIPLKKGSHADRRQGVCALELVAWLAGEPHSDQPVCTSKVIAAFIRRWNDQLGDADRNRLLKPLLPRMIGTAGDPAKEKRRAWMSTDWMVRVYLPAWLRSAKLTESAAAITALPEIVDTRGLLASMPAVERARKDAQVAWSAARATNWNTAPDPASSAAWTEARDEARNAAWYGGRDAAWDAAIEVEHESNWHVAWEVTRDAARTAARYAAWIAARAANRETARIPRMNIPRDAAWDAARQKLQPTVAALQLAAVDLLNRMIDA